MESGQVFVSTGTFRAGTLEALDTLMTSGIERIELSGGHPEDDLEDRLIALSGELSLQVHNYFPPAQPPFVFNLASADPEIRLRTISAMERAIELSARLGATHYGFHAGFLLDPPLSYLGASWRSRPMLGLARAQEIFVESVTTLKGHADDFGIQLLIENNVLTRGTLEQCGQDVLLMASTSQICDLMAMVPAGVALLIDTGHMKVTANSLGFDALNALRDLNRFCGGYHLSDNDGLEDSNGPVREDSWFWGELRRDVPFATLEVRPTGDLDLASQVTLTEQSWVRGTS